MKLKEIKIFNKIYEKLKKILDKVEKRYLVLFVMTIAIFIPYFSNEFVKGDDYICHFSNMLGMIKEISLRKGIFFPSKIHALLAHNFGYGDGIFYPQFSYYVTVYIYLFIKWFGVELPGAVKIYEFLLVYSSSIFMYKYVKMISNNKNVSLVASILYITYPYYVGDIFDRMAYSEFAIFLFMPIVFIGLENIIREKYKIGFLYFTIGYLGLLNSHLVLSVYFTFFAIIYLLVNYKKIFNKKAILTLVISSICILGISSPFWAPLLENKFNADYVVFKSEDVFSIGMVEDNVLSLSNLLNKNVSFKTYVYISFIILLLIGITILNYKEIIKKKEIKKLFIFSSLVTIISIFIATKFMNWEIMPEILLSIQFPWRMCVFLTFSCSIIASFAIFVVPDSKQKVVILIICILSFYEANTIVNMKGFQDYVEVDETLAASVYSSAMGYQYEYLTLNGKENLEYIVSRNSNEVIVENDVNAQIYVTYNKVPSLTFNITIDDDSKRAKVEIPRLYYLGYTIKFTSIGGNVEKLNYYENDRGFIEFEVPKDGTIEVTYTGTIINNISDIISVLLIIGIAIYFIRDYKINKNDLDNKE